MAERVNDVRHQADKQSPLSAHKRGPIGCIAGRDATRSAATDAAKLCPRYTTVVSGVACAACAGNASTNGQAGSVE